MKAPSHHVRDLLRGTEFEEEPMYDKINDAVNDACDGVFGRMLDDPAMPWVCGAVIGAVLVLMWLL